MMWLMVDTEVMIGSSRDTHGAEGVGGTHKTREVRALFGLCEDEEKRY